MNVWVLPVPTTPGGWTVPVLNDALRAVHARAQDVRAQLSTTNGQLVALDRRADNLSAAARVTAKAKIAQLVKHQADAIALYRKFSSAWAAAVAKARAFLKTIGLQIPTGLSGAPVLPIVALVVAGAVVLAAAYVAQVKAKADVVSNGTKALQNELAMLERTGQAPTPEQVIEINRQFAAQTAAGTTPGDPLGLSNALKALVPIAGLLAAALIVPSLLRAGRDA